ncbi:MAG TPA: ABC transporter permease [Blastocatellia bacterium]|nr:ABC transporter permease [Blastocatellia bacterium]
MMGLISVLVLLLLLELVGRTGLLFDPKYLPLPSTILSTAFRWDVVQELGSNLGVSLTRSAAGFILTSFIALPLGVAMARSALFFNLVEPLVEMIRPMPGAAIIPAALVLFGLGEPAKLIVIVIGSFGPLLVATYDSIRRVDPILLDTARMLHLSPSQSLTHIILPAASPEILSGARTTLAYAYILTVTVEMIFGTDGLGHFLIDMQRSINYPEMYLGIFASAMAGYLLYRLFLLWERAFLRWHYEYTRAGR